MEWLLVGLVACLASALTLFSGFGLGTLLLPAFAVFFPMETAVAMTALVHLANNLFKLVLFGRRADAGIVIRFGLPAVATALAGAWLLSRLSALPPLHTYSLAGRSLALEPVKVGLGGLMIAFALLEAWPAFAAWSAPRGWLPVGGALSGFFGGLSGHQGALRSAFLLRAGLSKEAFIATGVVIACVVDMTRLSLYSRHLGTAAAGQAPLLVFAMAMAWIGAYAGGRLVHKVTLRKVQLIVAVLLVLIGGLLALGLI